MARVVEDRIRGLEADPSRFAGVLAARGVDRIHFGCGPNLVEDWLNVDRETVVDPRGYQTGEGMLWSAGRRLYLQADTTRALPFPDETFRHAYAEHLIEHLDEAGGLAWLAETRRLVRAGGLLRLTTPDLGRYVESYLDPAGGFFPEHREVLAAHRKFRNGVPGRRAWMLNQLFLGWDHRWIYDLEELIHAASEAGFSPDAVRRCAFREGRVAEVAALDMEPRRHETLYVEIDA